MKNVLLIATLLLTVMSYGQRGEKRMEAREKMNPEQIASIKSKKMALELSLSEKQQKEVYDLTLKQAQDRPEKMSKEKMQKMSQEDRVAMIESKLDKQIEAKREFKKILNEQQYERFEKMMNKRKKGAKKKMKKRRENR